LRESGRKPAELIGYFRLDQPTAKWSDYQLVPIQNPAELKSVLSRTLGVLGVVKKQRTVFLFQNARIHLDKVENLGSFLEFEVVVSDEKTEADATRLLNFLIESFHIQPENLVSEAYVDLLKM
jgi:predicted adenylyl cyclase CyaB